MTLFWIKHNNVLLLDFRVVTNRPNLYKYFYPWSSILWFRKNVTDCIVFLPKTVSLMVEYYPIRFTLQNFRSRPAKSMPPWTWRILGGSFSAVVEETRTLAFENFVFNPVESTVLSTNSWRTALINTPLILSAGSSNFGKSVRHFSFLILANVFFFLKLRVAGVNYVLEALECNEISNIWYWLKTEAE